MKKLAVLGLVFGAIVTSSAFASANILGSGSAKVNASPSQVNDELIKSVKKQSEANAFENCIRGNEYDMCEMTTVRTTCEQGTERVVHTLTDIISEDGEGSVFVTISCSTDLTFDY